METSDDDRYAWNDRRRKPTRDHGVITTLVYLLSFALLACSLSWWLL